MKLTRLTCLLAMFCMAGNALAAESVPGLDRQQTIPWDQLGAKAQQGYPSDGLSIRATAHGAELQVKSQALKGQVTSDGLWLTSMSAGTDSKGDRFRVQSVSVGRGRRTMAKLDATGVVNTETDVVRFIRSGVVEEYRVSADGVRQDFIVEHRPVGEGCMELRLQVSGATAQAVTDGVRLVLEGSERTLRYHQLYVTDARGKVLKAKLNVVGTNELQLQVEDQSASYPIRIDPTFSDEDWVSMGKVSGVGGDVFAAASDAAGNLYIGGRFTTAHDTTVNNIAKWDGSTWSALGSGMNSTVRALALDGETLYAAGSFTTAGGVSANYIAKWNGTAWSAMGTGLNGDVHCMVVSAGIVYVGGSFFQTSNEFGGRIAKWNGSAWISLEDAMNGAVNALVFHQGDLYAGGSFSWAGYVRAKHIARWNGTAWSAVGAGLDHDVSSLASLGSDLFAGGFFHFSGTTDLKGVARWNGLSWSSLGEPFSGSPIDTLAVVGTTLYAGGYLAVSPGLSGFGCWRWQDGAWTKIGIWAHPQAIIAVGDDLYIGSGNYSGAGALNSGFYKWNGAAWATVGGTGTDGDVKALAWLGGELYAGGSFTVINGVPANGIARWNGDIWQPLAEGLLYGTLPAHATCMTVNGSDLYVGGNFTIAGSINSPEVAKWNGSSWSKIGASFDIPLLYALAFQGDRLFAGGRFNSVNGIAANNIAAWDGNTWEPVGGGTDDWVFTLLASSDGLYAGGDFTSAGGVTTKGIAKWNGTSWSALGAGLDKRVTALAMSGTDLYAGGNFKIPGSAPSSGYYAAKWDGTSWSPMNGLNIGFYNQVSAFAVVGSTVYASVSSYDNTTGLMRGAVQRWDGTNWNALGSPLSSAPETLLSCGEGLFIGGYFTEVGGKVSAYLALAKIPVPELRVHGNSVRITHGDPSPDSTDHTDFGAVNLDGAQRVRTFTITNAGGQALNLTGTPKVVISGEHAADFTVSLQPESPLAADNGSTTFSIMFDPSGVGTRSAVVSISSDDPDDLVFSYSIQGRGRNAGVIQFASATQTVFQGATSATLLLNREEGSSVSSTVTIHTQNGTASSSPPFAAALAGTDYVTPTGDAASVTFEPGDLTKSVSITLLPKAGSTIPNKRFTITISNPTDGVPLGAITTATVKILAADSTKPSLTLKTPGTKVSATLPMTVTGTAGDVRGLDRVEVSLNGAPAVPALLGNAANSGSVPFSLVVTPLIGNNTITVTAFDLRGNNTIVTRSFQFVRRYPFALTRNVPAAVSLLPDKAGTVTFTATPASNAAAFTPSSANANPVTSEIVAGTTIKLTANAKAGYAFGHWSGLPLGAIITGNVATCTMTSQPLDIQATFVDVPFSGPTGSGITFHGLLTAQSGTPSRNDTNGFITGALTSSNGSFTGKVLLGGKSHPLSATFFGNGQCVFNVGALRLNSLSLDGWNLSMNYSHTSRTSIDISLSKGSETCAGYALRESYSRAGKVPANLLNSTTRGYYTLKVAPQPGTLGDDRYPHGHGYATLALSNTGAVTIIGVLPDGMSITTTAALVSSSECPFFIQLPTPGAAATVKGGSIGGTLAFIPSETGDDVTSTTLRWFRPDLSASKASTATALYTLGWPDGLTVHANGAFYDTTRSIQSSLGAANAGLSAANAELRVASTKLAQPQLIETCNITGSVVRKTTSTYLNPWTLTPSPSVGTFSGSFSTAAMKPVFKGILIQKGPNTGGHGFFITNTPGDTDPESGRVTLSAD